MQITRRCILQIYEVRCEAYETLYDRVYGWSTGTRERQKRGRMWEEREKERKSADGKKREKWSAV